MLLKLVLLISLVSAGSLPPTYHYQFYNNYVPGVACSKSTSSCNDDSSALVLISPDAAGVFNSSGYCGQDLLSPQALNPLSTSPRSTTAFKFSTLVGGLYKVEVNSGCTCSCDASFDCRNVCTSTVTRTVIGSFANLNAPLKDKNFQNCHCAPDIIGNAMVFSVASCPAGSIYTIYTTGCNLCPSGSFQNLSAPISNPPIFVSRLGSPVNLDVPNVVFPQPCSPAPFGFYARGSGNTESGITSCAPSEYCGGGTVTPIPRSSIPFSNGAVYDANVVLSFETPEFVLSLPGMTIVVIGLGLIVLVFSLTVILLTTAKRSSRWDRTKGFFTKLDVLFPKKHSNDRPGVMIERQTVLGGLFTLMVPIVFIVVATFIVAQWQSSPQIKTNSIPFGLSSKTIAAGRFVITVRFFGYNPIGHPRGCLSTYQDATFSSGFTFKNSSYPVTTAIQGPSSCDVTWDSGPDAVPTVDVAVGVKQPGYASFLSWTFQAEPYVFAPLNQSAKAQISQTMFPTQPSSYLTIVNPTGGIFGPGTTDTTGATIVSLAATWMEYLDSTYFTSVKNSSGFASTFVNSQIGSTSTTQGLNFAPTEVGVFFKISRGLTFTHIEKSYQSSVGVLVGAILGYLSSIIAAFAVIMLVIEALERKRGKKQPQTVSDVYDRFSSSHDDVDPVPMTEPLISDKSPRRDYALYESPRRSSLKLKQPMEPAPLPPPRKDSRKQQSFTLNDSRAHQSDFV